MKEDLSSPPLSFSSFKEFWKYYLRQHQHPVNRLLHVAGLIGGWTCIGLACCLSWTWLLAVLPVGYGTAWLGHLVVERNRPATLNSPLWSLLAEYRMAALLLTGHRLSAPAVSDQEQSRHAA